LVADIKLTRDWREEGKGGWWIVCWIVDEWYGTCGILAVLVWLYLFYFLLVDVIYTGEKENNVSGAVPGLDSFCPFFTPDLYLSYQRWVPRYLPTRQLDN
jgi:uncharacterized membrane protein YhaH (DUF805 family)